jgi:phosphoenolpyruvate synthase/pyruvate phosphate dikinase
LVAARLTRGVFDQLSGDLGGFPFVKVVYDREKEQIHFINHHRYQFHADYIAERILGIPAAELRAKIDAYNESFYLAPERRLWLGILALHRNHDRPFLTLETVEIDTMGAESLRAFYATVRRWVDPASPLLWKPANLLQEEAARQIDSTEVPRVFAHELLASASFIALNPGESVGRLRIFRSPEEYALVRATIEWHDILVMTRVPDDIPRVSGIINAGHTTPLSHTNVLASGWGIPNAVELGIIERLEREGLNGKWVRYRVEANRTETLLTRLEPGEAVPQRPSWSIQRIKLEEPETVNTPIADLDELRMSDRYRFGTKAANLGELRHVLENGSERLLGFYRVKRPPRDNLLPYLAKFLKAPAGADLSREAWSFLRKVVRIPRGIALPFSVQQEFLESSPRIQQAIGKLKMALELNAREVDALSLSLQRMIRETRIPPALREKIDARIARSLAGVSSFVVRSSSNAEDLQGFSAAGIYESINHVPSADRIFEGIREVWASLLSPRSVRLRAEMGISLDDSYMGVIIQEEVPSHLGGVLVTTNPLKRDSDFRNVFINASDKSAIEVVQGTDSTYQYLFNTVEGGGTTVAVAEGRGELSRERLALLQDLAFAGRLLQSHFSPDYTFSAPVDIEWLANSEGLFLLQLRPYAG